MLAAPFSRTLSREVRQTSSHSYLPPLCLALPCFPVFSVYWYGQRLEFRARTFAQAEEKLNMSSVDDGQSCDPLPTGQVQSFNTCFFPFQLYYQNCPVTPGCLVDHPKIKETADRRACPQTNWDGWKPGTAGDKADIFMERRL